MAKYASTAIRLLQQFIVNQGEVVSVKRKADSSIQNYVCHIQALEIDKAVQYDPQGVENLANSQPHLFIFPHTCTISEGDQITVNPALPGKTYKAVSVQANRLEGRVITIECVGLRM